MRPQLAFLDHELVVARLLNCGLTLVELLPRPWTIGLWCVDLGVPGLVVSVVGGRRALRLSFQRHPTRIVHLIVLIEGLLEECLVQSGLDFLLQQVEDVLS